MKRKVVSGIVLSMLFMGMLTLAINIQQTESSEPPETEWNKTYGGANGDRAWSVVETSDGGYALAGETTSFGAGVEDFWLVKVDSSGNHQWNKTYGGTKYDCAKSVVQTGDGGYAIVGITQSFGVSVEDFWLVKVDSSGNHQWNKTYGAVGYDSAYSVVETGDGGYAIAGYCGFANLVKTDADGNQQWNKSYGGSARCVVETSDGGYALAGDRGLNFWLVKTDSSGNVQWSKTYGGPDMDLAFSVVETSDGGYAIAGYTDFGLLSSDFWLVKVDSSGNHQWNKTYGGVGYDFAYSVVETGDGGYAIAGGAESFGAGIIDFWLVKVDSSGNHQWNKTYGGTNYDCARSTVKTSDGGYALAGWTNSFGAGAYDFWLVKVGASLPPPVIGASLDIDPDTLNLKSSGEWITAYVELPSGYDVNNIDVESILLNGVIPVATDAPVTVGDYDVDGIPDLMVKFNRAEVIDFIGTIDFDDETGKFREVTLTVSGTVGGEAFEGSDTVKVII